MAPSITDLVVKIEKALIDPALLLLFMVGLLVFVVGVVQFMLALSGGGKNLEEGKRHMLWGVIGMIIMASAVGILNFIGNVFGNSQPLNTTTTQSILR